MFRSLKSLYFSNRKNYTFNEDFIISDFIISENKVSFKLLTFFDDFGIEEFIILDKQLHELFNSKEVVFSVDKISLTNDLKDYYYIISYNEFISKVNDLLKEYQLSLKVDDRINFLDKKIEIFIENSADRFKLISNGFIKEINEFLLSKNIKDTEIVMLNSLHIENTENKFNLNIKDKLKKIQKEIVLDRENKENKQDKKNNSNEQINHNFRIGRKISEKEKLLQILDLDENTGNCKIEGKIYNLDIRDTKSGKKIVSFELDDDTSAITCKKFFESKDIKSFNEIVNESSVKKGLSARLFGKVSYDSYIKSISMFVTSMEIIPNKTYVDNAKEKRVELHLNSQMTGLDGCVSLSELKNRLLQMGHSAVGVTDIGVVQAYPEMMNLFSDGKIKALYGVEMNLLEDHPRILYNYKKTADFSKFVAFDIETTGLSHLKNKITEIGAVRIENGQVVETFNELVNPEQLISEEITNLTGITNEMVVDKPIINEVLPRFLEFAKGCVLVAHNAEFDISFIKTNSKRLNLNFDPTFIDTMGFARSVLPNLKNHKLNTLCKELSVTLLNHHRASCDAQACGGILLELIKIIEKSGKTFDENINEIETSWPKSRNISYNSIIYVKEMKALSGFYKMISKGLMKYFRKVGNFPKSELKEYRDGLLIGSGNWDGELFRAFLDEKSEKEILDIASFYDFFEIQPISNLMHLYYRGKVLEIEDLKNINRKIYNLGKKLNKLVVATGNVKYLDKNDYIFRNVILYSQGNKKLESEGAFYFRNTQQMLEEFSYLGKDEAFEVVVTNTNKIKDSLEDILPIPNGTFPPFIEGADEELKKICYEKARSIYGEKLPEIVENRLERELNSIIKNGYAVLYIIAQKLVWKSNDDGYLVGSRGSVGSSFAATMAGITEVNPLIPHYICENCKFSEFHNEYSGMSGVDMPDKVCPNCGKNLLKQGHDIPFEVFLGFDGDKEPDIDLNFAGEYQPTCHKYTEELFGHDKVFRAGTIGTISDKTAYGYVKKYTEENEITLSTGNMNRYARKIDGIKRTSGQHPGGVMIVPHNKEIYDFTPIQYPADDPKSGVITTHFSYKAISGRILKLDLLGHDVPTIIKHLSDLTSIDPLTIPMDDKETLKIFSSTEGLKFSSDKYKDDVGTLGVPEFGTSFVRGMLLETRPKTLTELIRISGLSHGTDVWLNNAQDLVNEGMPLADTICTRDDIMTYLIFKGLDKKKSFKIMETVRKGKPLDEETQKYMLDNNIPDWYLKSCKKIKYLFPKAHAVAYVLMSYRIAYFKVHYPEAFYATYFTTKIDEYLGNLIFKGLNVIQAKMNELKELGNSATKKEKDTLSILEVAEEMYLRGIVASRVDLEKSHYSRFLTPEKGKILPPFRALEGVSEADSISIYNESKKLPFLSIEDFQNRTKINKNALEALKEQGVLNHLQQSNQISLFDMM